MSHTLSGPAWRGVITHDTLYTYVQSVYDEGYTRNASSAHNLISTFLLNSQNADKIRNFDWLRANIYENKTKNDFFSLDGNNTNFSTPNFVPSTTPVSSASMFTCENIWEIC
jgi:hypothetical protein